MINRKIPWTSQPQFTVGIDQGNPLTRGLTDCYSGATIGFNNATGKNVTVTGGGSGYSQRAVQGGKSLYTPNGGWADISVGKDWAGPNTVIALMILRGIDSSYGGLFSKNSSGTSNQLQVGRNSTSDNLYLSVGDSTLGVYGSSSISGLTGVPAIVAFSHSGVTSTNGSYYLNGVKGNDTNVTLSAQNTGTGALGLGRERASNAGYDSDVDWLLFLRWNRVLAAPEIISISNNPWQIFQPLQRRIFVASAGGGVSLSLTGQSLTANLGALSASVTSSVTGNQTTLQQGTITANVSKTLTGQAISLVQGSVLPNVVTAITGQEVSLAQGSVTDASSGNVTKALSGQSLSVSQGALTASISLALNGQSIVLSGGSVSPAISSALAGQQSSVQQGTISANISAGLTGQAVVLSNGTVAQAGSDVTKALTGQQLSIALGVLLEKKTIARPSSDTTAGAWLPSTGSSLYATLDEVSPDDADYIYTNSVSTCKIALNAVTDPLTSSGQIVSYRVWSPNSDGLTVRLMQGATEIASWTHTVLPTSPTTYQQTLTAGQCDAITDYSVLAIQLESV